MALRTMHLFAGAGGLTCASKEVLCSMVTEETKQRMSAAAKNRCTSQWRAECSKRLRTKIDDNMLRRLYESGHTQKECAEILCVGRKVVSNAMKRLGIKSRVASKRDQWGSKNVRWKGKKASLTSKHRRLYRAFGQPSKCDVCGTDDNSKTYDWANLTGNYDDPYDFMRMCRSCHWKHDNKHLNFKGMKCGT